MERRPCFARSAVLAQVCNEGVLVNEHTRLSALKECVKSRPALYAPVLATYKTRALWNAYRSDPEFFQDIQSLISAPEKYIVCHWEVSTNFGDALSPTVVEMLSGKTPVPLSRVPGWLAKDHFSVVGSILQFPSSSRTEVWGSGFISADARFPLKPRRIHAVRGPLTRQKCLDQGVECPEVYGDPSVFLFDQIAGSLPRRSPNFKVALVPHYSDQSHPIVRAMCEREDVKFVNVRWPVEEVVAALWDCQVVVSSSLHGLILADSLGIPSRWLGVSDVVVRGGFKFQDYFQSVARQEPEPLSVESLTVQSAIQEARYEVKSFDKERLLEVCPFLNQSS